MNKIFNYNYYKNLKRPITYIGTPRKHIIGTIISHELQTDFCGNAMNEGTFKVNRYEDSEPSPFYSWITVGMYVLLHGIDWFVISEVKIINEGLNEYKEVVYKSLEHELAHKYITSLGSLGTSSDEQGGLDMYCLYSVVDVEHSILHQIIKKNPDWWIKYIDPSITSEYRSFQVDNIDTYTFLTDNVSSAFDCIFLFDSSDKSISAYTLEHLGHDTGITLSYRNFIKSINQKSDDSEIKTVLTVVGGNDVRTNTPLGIAEVNISGTNQLFDFSYYLKFMSEKLQNGLSGYEKKCKQNESAYQQKLIQLGDLYISLNDLKSKAPSSAGSMDWTQYGLSELQTQEKIYKTNMSLYTNQDDSALFTQNSKIHQAIEAEISKRKTQIINKEAEILTCQKQVQSLVVSLEDYLGETLYKELSAYIKEDTLTDDSFIVTSIMTDDEILEMQKSLMNHAKKELAKVCYPKFDSEIDLINFTVNYDYKIFTDSLEMFNILHIRLEDHDVILNARLLKMHVNWDDPSDFKVTFSNRDSLTEPWGFFEEIKNQAQSTASQIGFASGAWRDAAQSSIAFQEYQNSVFDASLKQLQSSSNQEWVLDETGLMLKKWLPDEGRYDPVQLWATSNVICFTTTGWDSVSLALGHVKMGNDYFYGLAAQSVVGKLLMGNQLYITNSSGTYTVDDKGLTAKNGSYQVKINPNTPSDIFSISIDNKKLLYVDANNKKLKFEGDIESTSGHIANYVISGNSLTSGNVGMSSDKAVGAKAFWAGSATSANAAFWVDNTGKLSCSNVYITGGYLKVGSKFEVTSDGILTATNGKFSGDITASSISGGSINGTTITGGSLSIGKSFKVNTDGILSASGADISGKITATSGKIGGWTIEGNTLKGSSGSYIKGGEINMGDGFFKANDGYVGLGEFEVTSTSRGVFQSKDETTGMSAELSESGEWYLWAGWGHGQSGEEALFLVNSGQVRCGGDLYVKGVNILEAIRNLNSCSSYGCDCNNYSCSTDACGGGDECGSAYTGGGCGSDSGSCSKYSSGGCTCDGSYDVPGCTIVSTG